MSTTSTAPPGNPTPPPKSPSLFSLLGPYRGLVALLIVLGVATNALALWIPLIISHGIDAFSMDAFNINAVLLQFCVAGGLIFVLTYLQSIVQNSASERVARDLRRDLAAAISRQGYADVQELTPGKLLTNLTSDIDAIKLFVAQAIVQLVASMCVIVGASTLLLLIDWRLALAVLALMPIIGVTFFLVLRKVRALFVRGQEIIDWLNKVINESILASALIRVLHSQDRERVKFLEANTGAMGVGMSILKLFAALIPVVTLVSNLTIVVLLLLGGRFVIGGSLTLGEFAAFQTYLGLLIFPILVLGFISGLMARAGASYARVSAVLTRPEPPVTGTETARLRGDVEVRDLVVRYGEKFAVKEVSFFVPAGTRTAIIGPTAAGKTQLLSVITGLIRPTSGEVFYDGRPLSAYAPEALHAQVGFVFQDSVTFNMTLRENIAFNTGVTEEAMKKAIEAAELSDLIASLPEGLQTVVSERGTSLSGGQKQRLMLARALALDPKVLLLDDFTARVDQKTESTILGNVARLYPGITLISVTQKIGSVEDYDQILLLMEGELLARGTHAELMSTSPEYVQIFQSQRSTNAYDRPQP